MEYYVAAKLGRFICEVREIPRAELYGWVWWFREHPEERL
jgi:hypothetical protein